MWWAIGVGGSGIRIFGWYFCGWCVDERGMVLCVFTISFFVFNAPVKHHKIIVLWNLSKIRSICYS